LKAATDDGNKQKRIVIEWRHVDLGVQCGPCRDTGRNLWNVIEELSQEHLLDDVEVEFQNTLLPEKQYLESNVVLVNGMPIEQILDAGATFSGCQECPDTPGEPSCYRADNPDRNVFKAIPQEILRTALVKVLGRQ
jgi:hypothetical protein